MLNSAQFSKTRLIEVFCLFAFSLCFAGPLLTQGFFKYDDFQLIQVLVEHGFIQSLGEAHGDQGVLGLRLGFAALWSLFGNNPLGWNISAFLSFVLLGFVFLKTLHFYQVSLKIRILGLLLLYSWAPWTEMFYGYYCLLMYPWITIFFLLALNEIEKYFLDTNASRLLPIALWTSYGTFISIAAAWVLPSLFLLCLVRLKKRLWTERPFRFLVLIMFVIGLMFASYQYVLVIQKGLFLSQKLDVNQVSFLQRLCDFVIGGWLLPFLSPYLYLLVQNIGPLKILGASALAGFIAIYCYKSLRASKKLETLIVLCVPLFVYAALVLSGRSWEGFRSWSAKYTGNFHVLMLLLILIGVHFLQEHNKKVFKIFLILLVLPLVQQCLVRADFVSTPRFHYLPHTWQREAALERKKGIAELSLLTEKLSEHPQKEWPLPMEGNVGAFSSELGAPYPLCIYSPFLKSFSSVQWYSRAKSMDCQGVQTLNARAFDQKFSGLIHKIEASQNLEDSLRRLYLSRSE